MANSFCDPLSDTACPDVHISLRRSEILAEPEINERRLPKSRSAGLHQSKKTKAMEEGDGRF